MLFYWTLMAAGIVTILWSFSALILIPILKAEHVFKEERPRWLIGICWVYLTLAFLSWAGLLQAFKPMSFFAMLMITLTAVKFFLIHLFYKDIRTYLILMWQSRLTMAAVSVCSSAVGALMLFIACRTL